MLIPKLKQKLTPLISFSRKIYNMSGPIIEVEQGKLQGKQNDNKFCAFKGIPYAKPPLGNLRFSVPAPPEAWSGIRDATKDCNICAQYSRETKSVIGSEDCLYLNVYTPKFPSPSDELLPVMVFIHGGAFVFGSGTNEAKHGAEYLVKKDVIVVTLNYRLGILGFLSLDRKDAPGNMGLRDQVQALKWVKNNIKQFGGDPNNVTIFGISAGGASVEYLMLSPLASGLFHKAIAQSGSSLLPWAQNDRIRDLTMKIPAMEKKVIKNDEELLHHLKNMNIEHLVMNSMTAISQDNLQGGLYSGYVPTIEKPKDWEPFLDKSPYDLITQGSFTKVPFVTGFCSREGLLMRTSMQQERLNIFMSENKFETYLDNFAINDLDIDEVTSKLKEVYLTDIKLEEPDTFVIDFFSDLNFIGGIYTASSYIAKYNSSVYLYEFSYDGNLNHLKKKLNINRKGACHADDTGYIFKTDKLQSENLSKTDKLVRERMLLMWTNLAKYGVPVPEVNEVITTKWEPVDANMAYMHIDAELSMRQEPYPKRTQLFKELYDNYYSKKFST